MGRFAELDRILDEAVANGVVAGAHGVLLHRGEAIYERALGLADREAEAPVTTDTIFRLASMTKPIVSVLALQLVERGLLELEGDVRDWLPGFTPALPDGSRPVIRLWHLLTHTAGLGYVLAEAEDGAHRSLAVSAGLDARMLSAEENVAQIGRAPLCAEPGTQWRYSCATDVLGYILERVSGDSLETLFQERIAGPLGMVDTAFVARDPARLAAAYRDGMSGPVRMAEGAQVPAYGGHIAYSPSRATMRGSWFSGGVGLTGTARDYVRFLRALSEWKGALLDPGLGERLIRDEIGDLAGPAPGMGWGLGAAVVRNGAEAGIPGQEGTWSWGGVYGTHFFVNPSQDLIWVCLTNTALAGMAGTLPDALRRAVHEQFVCV